MELIDLKFEKLKLMVFHMKFKLLSFSIVKMNSSKFVFYIGVLSFFMFATKTELQAQYWDLKKINNDVGLSNSAVTSIFTDSREYMWFGTWDGLNRYDGKQIKDFIPDPTIKTSIGNNIIREIFEDKNNSLWVVTDKNINKYDHHTESFEVFLNSDDFFFKRERIIRSSISKDSTLWCSIYDKGIAHYSYEKNEFSQIEPINSNSDILKKIIGIKAFSDQRLVLVTETGNLITLIKENQWIPVRIDSLSTTTDVIPSQHWFIDISNKHLLFMALEGGGLLYVDLNTGILKKIEVGNSNFNITEINKNKDDAFLWLGTDSGKILRLFINKEISIENLDYLFPELISEKVKILKIFESQPNLLWIGTDGNGIYEYNTKETPFSSITKGDAAKGELSHNIVRAIYEDPSGKIIVGTRGGGLNKFTKNLSSNEIVTTENGLSNNAVLAINRDKKNNYWIGVDGEGIDFLESESGKILHFPDDFINNVDLLFKSVYSICIDSYENIWLGTSGYGIIKLSIEKIRSGKYRLKDYEQFLSTNSSENNLKSDIVYSILEDRPNFLWIGSRGGSVQLLNTITKEFSTVNIEIERDVISLFKSKLHEELWVGTSSGLYKMSLIDKSLTFYNESNGLPNNTIHAVQEDYSGNIWISTNRGLSSWNRKSNKFRNYNKNDGLAGNEYSDGASFFGGHTKRIYFGGINGLTIVESHKVNNSEIFPRLTLQELKLFNNSITPGDDTNLLKKHIDNTDTITFDSHQNFFSIGYSALNYFNNENSEYAYYLEGFDKSWNFVGKERTAYFTNVPPGEYTLKLKSSNQDGIWNNEYRTVHIIVTPPIWNTYWAYIIYSIIIMILISLVYLFLKRRNNIKRQLYVAQLEKRNNEEINNYKLSFFTNVSHEFRTPLSLILFPASKLFDQKHIYPELSSSFDSIYNNANRLLKLIGELIEFRKAESDQTNLVVGNGKIFLFLKQITSAFTSYAENHNISISFEHDPEDSANIWFDHDKLKTIMLNLISNAIKYNCPNGIVTVSITIDKEIAYIKVEDTGIGISENLLDKIFQRFFNLNIADLPRMDSSNSSGIGLALTKSLVESHKGTIQVSSKKGEGSVFHIQFPVDKESYLGFLVDKLIDTDPLIIAQKIDAEFTNFKTIKNKTIVSTKEIESRYCLLIVDDNEQFRAIIREMFITDYSIIEADNGAQAIDIIKEHSIDLIISDVLMPEINGYELCKKIKDDINTCHIPVILLTAMGEIENRIKGIDIGADSFIPKPFHPKHLIARVEKLLKSKQNIRELLKNAPWKLAENVNGLVQKDQIWLNRLEKFILENMNNSDLDSSLLIEEFAISKTQLYRKMKAVTDHTPHGFIKKYRLRKAADLLKNSDKTISEITYETGFNNRSYFYRSFKEEHDCSPSDFRNAAN
jgi:signal transduction histidine kinase/ligand-binding sensor domain-containing protein/DNA-binding response OmpR family regulator